MPKRKGNRFEVKTMHYLEERGFRCMRSAGSMGPWDVIAVSGKRVLLVSVAANEWPRATARKILEKFARPAWVDGEIWRWDDRAAEPIILPVR
jgi:Holliday junction resolvase-like predicted endonuclease